MFLYIKPLVQTHFLSFCLIYVLSFSSNVHSNQNTLDRQGNKTALIMGVFPRRNASITIKLFSPITKHLSEKLGRKVQLETAKDFGSFWKKVLLQRYDIVHFNQYHYIKTRDKNKYIAILQNEEFGKRTIAGAITVRKDSGINSLQDLKNKKITFGGGKKAMIAYVVPTALLHRAGLIKGDYVEQFTKNPPNSLLSVYYKQADAAGTGNSVLSLPMLRNSIDTSKIKYLVSSKPLAHLPWAVKTNMPKSLSTKIQNIMLDLNNSSIGKEVLKTAKLTGIHTASDHDYDPYRKILHEVFGNNY